MSNRELVSTRNFKNSAFISQRFSQLRVYTCSIFLDLSSYSRRFFTTNGHANVECKLTIGRNVDFTRSSALISISSAFKCGGVPSEHLKLFPRSLFHASESRNNPLLFESRCCRTIGTAHSPLSWIRLLKRFTLTSSSKLP